VKLCGVSHVFYWPGLLTLLPDSRRENFSQVFSGTEYPYELNLGGKICKKFQEFGKEKIILSSVTDTNCLKII